MTLAQMQMHGPRVLCDTHEQVADALVQLSCLKEITFDSEGVDLSRTGPITLLQISATQPTPFGSLPKAFLFDVLALGPAIFDIDAREGERCTLKMILESNSVLKVTFDCRADSDALFHQFGVLLQNVLDVQVCII